MATPCHRTPATYATPQEARAAHEEQMTQVATSLPAKKKGAKKTGRGENAPKSPAQAESPFAYAHEGAILAPEDVRAFYAELKRVRSGPGRRAREAAITAMAEKHGIDYLDAREVYFQGRALEEKKPYEKIRGEYMKHKEERILKHAFEEAGVRHEEHHQALREAYRARFPQDLKSSTPEFDLAEIGAQRAQRVFLYGALFHAHERGATKIEAEDFQAGCALVEKDSYGPPNAAVDERNTFMAAEAASLDWSTHPLVKFYDEGTWRRS